MAERLCQEVAQFLADHDDCTDGQPAGLARARVAVSLAEGLGGEVGDGPPDHATVADDPGRLAAFLDVGLPQSERSAVIAALADDATRRAETSSAAAFLDGIDGACPPLPAGLVARAVATFGASPAQGQPVVGQGQWSRSWLPPRILWPSLVALVLVAVLTPVVLSLIWEEGDVSVRDSRGGPIERSLAPPPGTGKRTPADRSTVDPAPRSCEPAANAAQSDQPAGNTHKAGTEATEPAGGETMKPEDRGAAQSAGTSADDPCRPGPSVDGGSASTRAPPPAPVRN
jgi:hypothetical protein